MQDRPTAVSTPQLMASLAAALAVQLPRTCVFARILGTEFFIGGHIRLGIIMPVAFLPLPFDFAVNAGSRR